MHSKLLIFKQLIVLLSLRILHANAASVCRARDYEAVFGSREFDISEFVASVSPDGESLIIGGTANFNSRRRVLESAASSSKLGEFDLAELTTDSAQQFEEETRGRRELSIPDGDPFGFIFTYNLHTCDTGVFIGMAGLGNGVKAVFTEGWPVNVFVGYDSDYQEFVINNDSQFAFANPDEDTVLSAGLGWHGNILVVAGSQHVKLIDTLSEETRELTLTAQV